MNDSADDRREAQPLSRPAARSALCIACGYSLRGITSDRCPECGLLLTVGVRRGVAIPWEYRASIGWWRAYWRMVWWVLFKPEAVMAASQQPLRADAARVFWRWTVAGVSAVIIASLLLHFAVVMIRASAVVSLGILVAAIPVALSVATGTLASDCHPVSGVAEERERGIALSYYLSALAWPLGFACGAVSCMYWVFPVSRFNFPVLVGATLLLLTVGVGSWWGDLAAYISQVRLRARGPYTTFGWSAVAGMGLAVVVLGVAAVLALMAARL